MVCKFDFLQGDNMQFIAENEKYKVYSSYEDVYLKEKKACHHQDEFSEKDRCIGSHYGDPNDGIITENYVIVSGHGILIYDLKNHKEKHVLNSAKNEHWTNAIHQDMFDDYHTEFRFVSYNSENKLRVFKMNILTEELTELD